MYRKLIACLLVFFLFCSPAYASTSSSALAFQVSPLSLNDGVMTAANVSSFDFSFRTGYYDAVSDSYVWGSFVNKAVSDGSFSNGTASYVGSYNPKHYQAVQFKFTDFGSLSDIRCILNSLYIGIQYNYNVDTKAFYVHSSTVNPFICNVNSNYTGTGREENESGTTTFFTTSVEHREGLSSPLRQSEPPQSIYLMLDSTLPFNYPDVQDGWSYVNDETVAIENVKCNEFTITMVFPLNDMYVQNNDSLTPFSDVVSPVSGSPLRYRVYVGGSFASSYCVISGSSLSDSSGISSAVSVLSQSISNVQRSLTTGFSEVKQTISKGAADVKNEISTQTKTLTDKLTDVKDGIVQGVTELKETTEQGFEDVVQGITDLPDKIQEMLTEFIVPDEDAVADKMTDFQDLAEEKLGIIYQVPEMLFDAVNALVNGATNPQTTMTFPAFSLPWIDGSQLRVWDSQQFEIIPSGLENLRDLIQTVTSMVFVIMTFNSLKRAYERFFLGGGS